MKTLEGPDSKPQRLQTHLILIASATAKQLMKERGREHQGTEKRDLSNPMEILHPHSKESRLFIAAHKASNLCM